MLDKLAIRLPSQLTPNEAHEALSGLYDSCSYPIQTKYFGFNRVYYRQHGAQMKAFVGVSALPKCGQQPLRLEFNPTRSDYKEVLECTSLFGDPEMGEVVRLDHTVDIPLPVEQFYNSLLLSRKKIRRDWTSGDLEGFAFGKYPEQLVVYDKAKEQKLNQVLTRVELRQFQHKCHIKKLLDLPKHIEHQPFKKLEFISIESTKINSTSEVKGILFKGLVEQYGMQGAFKILNKHGNFKRDFKNEIQTANNNSHNLDEIYQVGIKSFLGG